MLQGTLLYCYLNKVHKLLHAHFIYVLYCTTRLGLLLHWIVAMIFEKLFMIIAD